MLSVHIQKKLPHFFLDVSFQVDNEIVVLFGPSGAGKTTILNSIAGLTNPDSGTIALNERFFFSRETKRLPVQKRHIGYVFQDYALFPHMTVEKNIMYGSRSKDKQTTPGHLQQLIDVLGIGHLLSKYPRHISGGERQRVALARALATEPEVLLLDEPFSALDAATRVRCQEELMSLHTMWNIPVILVTHDLQEADKLGDRIIFLEEGKICEDTKSRHFT
ncbi:ATP-binding cassette domain-containing protein [Aneurinibacillus terranovensis]|uniref:ATP-binding cassette domain-containing protein n=1 Tax=Aneurinibacillus terranovensis TaxID=278991 RepID=UPI0004246463|nr:ATP-binding cassette domain-containing protein [Aneurinibacillus terranovensis]